jgi:hypothetical protein
MPPRRFLLIGLTVYEPVLGRFGQTATHDLPVEADTGIERFLFYFARALAVPR